MKTILDSNIYFFFVKLLRSRGVFLLFDESLVVLIDGMSSSQRSDGTIALLELGCYKETRSYIILFIIEM